jgi:hypothetical protein
VACSRGRHTCTVHTPDKAALLDRLPSGNREAALDMLNVELTQRKSMTYDRWGFWAKVREQLHALETTVGHALDVSADYLKEMALRAHHSELWFGHAERQRERDRQAGFER